MHPGLVAALRHRAGYPPLYACAGDMPAEDLFVMDFSLGLLGKPRESATEGAEQGTRS
jgi:hypothetical protein